MDLFNKTFFQFAFGFIGIIAVSVLVIMFIGGHEAGRDGKGCLANCVEDK